MNDKVRTPRPSARRASVATPGPMPPWAAAQSKRETWRSRCIGRFYRTASLGTVEATPEPLAGRVEELVQVRRAGAGDPRLDGHPEPGGRRGHQQPELEI